MYVVKYILIIIYFNLNYDLYLDDKFIFILKLKYNIITEIYSIIFIQS